MSQPKRTAKSSKAAAEPAPSPAPSPRASMQSTEPAHHAPPLILRGAHLLELTPGRVRRADLHIERGRVRGFDPANPSHDTTILDCSGYFVLPGMLSADTRLHASIMRSFPGGPRAGSTSTIASALWRYEGKLTRSLLAKAVTLGALDALRAGTTAVLHRQSNELAGQLGTESLSIVADALATTGLRASIGLETSQRISREGGVQALRETERFLSQRSKIHGRVRGFVAAESVAQLDNVLADMLAELVARYQVPFLLGLGDGAFEREKNGVRISQWLRHFGLVTERLLACVGPFVDEDELAVLAHLGASMVMTLRTTRRLGLDDPRRISAVERWLIGTGLDHPSLYAELDAVAGMQAQRGLELDASALLARHHNLLGQIYDAPFGRFDAGMVADFIVARYRPNVQLNEATIAHHLSYGMPGLEVVHAIVDGEIVLQDGQHPTLDEAKLRADTHQELAKL